ncbi:MAG: hypothetical protein ACC661_07300, partial [Verrucomicrobiales bacterium]
LVDYDYSFSGRNRTKDELIGIMIRILDPDGKTVGEHREGSSKIKSFSWDSKDGKGSGSLTIKPIGG